MLLLCKLVCQFDLLGLPLLKLIVCHLPAAGLGELRNDNDANCTYEGENSLLLQQTSRWLLNVWANRQKVNPSDFPYGSLAFLVNADGVLKEKCQWNTTRELVDPASKYLF